MTIQRFLPVGTPVDVRERFRGLWSHGFEISDLEAGGYLVLRMSDRFRIPARFDATDVRRSS
jgi:hypothetical protein